MRIYFFILIVMLSCGVFAAESYLRSVDLPAVSGSRLLTAARTLRAPDGRTIILVGTAHTGSDTYFNTLQKKMDSAPLVLFECASFFAVPNESLRIAVVRDILAEYFYTHKRLPDTLSDVRATMIARGGSLRLPVLNDAFAPFTWTRTNDIIRLTAPTQTVQIAAADLTPYRPIPDYARSFSEVIGLRYQMTTLRYDRPTCEPCDLNPTEMIALGKEKSIETRDINVLPFVMTKRPNPVDPEQETQLAMLRNDPMQRMLATLSIIELLPAQSREMLANDPFVREIIVNGRNAKVVQRLAPQKPCPAGTIILYGAAHMDVLEDSLAAAYGFTPVSTEWIPVCDVTHVPAEILTSIRAEKDRIRQTH